MKPFHILVGLGALLIIGVAGWYLYLTKVPNYPKTDARGIELPASGAKKAAPVVDERPAPVPDAVDAADAPPVEPAVEPSVEPPAGTEDGGPEGKDATPEDRLGE